MAKINDVKNLIQEQIDKGNEATGGSDTDLTSVITTLIGSMGGESEEVIVDLALSGGNQEVTPSDGKTMSKVTINKPSTLLAENIAEGIDIAGIIGTLTSPKIAMGSFQPSASNNKAYPLTHGLGVVPDIFILWRTTTVNTSYNYLHHSIGFSSKLKTALSLPLVQMTTYSKVGSSTDYQHIYATSTFTTDYSTVAYGMGKADEETITLGCSSYPLYYSTTYYWVAVGGLA